MTVAEDRLDATFTALADPTAGRSSPGWPGGTPR